MPNPASYSSEKDWMGACMHQVQTVEGKAHDQAIAQCLNMWKNAEVKQILVQMADDFDKRGLTAEANMIDKILKEAVGPSAEIESGIDTKTVELLQSLLNKYPPEKVLQYLEQKVKDVARKIF